jgi:hypothetical protein
VLKIQPPISFDEVTHSYIDPITGETIPSVTTILGAMSGGDKWYKDNGNKERGTEVHSLLEDLDNGHPVFPEGEFQEAALEHYRAFLKDSSLRPVKIEWRVYEDELGYAGTLDRLYETPSGKLYLVDIKTGSSVPSWTRLQTAAYLVAAVEQGRWGNTGRACLRINPDKLNSYKLIHYGDNLTDISAWRGVLNDFRARS